jgi:hypothetical protein
VVLGFANVLAVAGIDDGLGYDAVIGGVGGVLGAATGRGVDQRGGVRAEAGGQLGDKVEVRRSCGGFSCGHRVLQVVHRIEVVGGRCAG